jgi:hypothetical protein
MKFLNIKSYLLLFLVACGINFFTGSCSDDDNTAIPANDKSALIEKIAAAQTLINTTEEGTAEGQYLRGSKNVLQEVVDIAQDVYNDGSSTQAEVDNTVVNLGYAMAYYEAREVTPVAYENLMGQWAFDEGEGTTVADYSSNGFDGTLMSGSDTWGGGYPIWTNDRFGEENKALEFDKGAYVTVPYNSALNPDELSVSVWVKADEILENNRFIGLHSWLGYKFQLQSANKPFFTAATTDGTFDKDTDPALDTGTWYHLVVTAGNGELVFYINGEKVKTCEDVTGTMAKITDSDLVFGRGSDKYAADDSNYNTDHIIPLSWGGYFHGALDDIRIYNTILTSSQVLSIFESEKVSGANE